MSTAKAIGELLIFEKSSVYVVRGKIGGRQGVIYVGKAGRQSVARRLTEHLTGTQAFGKMLLKEHPRCLSWKVTVYTKEECAAYLGRRIPFKNISEAETAMIDSLNPIANRRRKSRK